MNEKFLAHGCLQLDELAKKVKALSLTVTGRFDKRMLLNNFSVNLSARNQARQALGLSVSTNESPHFLVRVSYFDK